MKQLLLAIMILLFWGPVFAEDEPSVLTDADLYKYRNGMPSDSKVIDREPSKRKWWEYEAEVQEAGEVMNSTGKAPAKQKSQTRKADPSTMQSAEPMTKQDKPRR